jgi:archaellum component FlaF (FlaF/FlaG flagellin family)
MQIHDQLKLSTLALGNFATGGVIGSAAATVDVVSAFSVAQTTANQTLSLPAPTDASHTTTVTVTNTGTTPFKMGATLVYPNNPAKYYFANGRWMDASTAQQDFYRDGGKANTIMTGGGNILYDLNGNLSWSARFIVIGGGGSTNGAVYSTDGHYTITMPPVGTVIPARGNGTPITVTAAGIPLNGQWGALYYRLSGGASGVVNSNFVFVGWGTGDYTVDSDMVLIAAVNADSPDTIIRLGTGQMMGRGSRLSNGLVQNDFYRDGGKPNLVMTAAGTITYTDAGFLSWTGRIIMLGGGTGNGTNNQAFSASGFYDITMPPVGTVIPGAGGNGNITVTAAGIRLTTWGTLYYRLSGGNNASIASNFVWVGFGTTFAVTADMVVVATCNQETGSTYLKMGTGDVLWNGDSVSRNKPAVAWRNATFLGSWTNFGSGFHNAQFRRMGDVVELRGLVRGGAQGSTIFNLPVGFRPLSRVLVPTVTSPDAIGRIDIDAGGNVIAVKSDPNWLGLDSVRFSIN